MKNYFKFDIYFNKNEIDSYNENLKNIVNNDSENELKPSFSYDNFGEEDETEEQKSIHERQDIKNDVLIDYVRHVKNFRNENSDYKIPIKNAEYDKKIDQSGLNCVKIGGKPVFIPDKDKLKHWALKSHEMEEQIKNYLLNNNLNIVDIIKNFQNQSDDLKQMIIDYILQRISYSPLVLRYDNKYGYAYYASPITKLNAPKKTNFFFEELMGVDVARKIDGLINSNLFDAILNVKNNYSKSPLLPFAFGSFDDGVDYFRHGNPLTFRPLGASIYKGKNNKNSTFFINSSLGVSHDSFLPLANISSGNISYLIANCIDECKNKNINFLTLEYGVHDIGQSAGHALASCFKLENGKINGVIFNNTNRALSKESFYFYLYPLLRELNSSNLLSPPMAGLVKQIDRSVFNFFKKNNLDFLDYNNISNLLYDEGFDYAYQSYCNHKDKEGYCNYDLNIKMQGSSGFCLEGSYQVGVALARQIAKNGYPRKGELSALKKYKDVYHRMPDKTFGHAVRADIKSVYKNFTKKGEYGSLSDLKIYALMNRVAIYQKSEMILKFHRDIGNIVGKENLQKFYENKDLFSKKFNKMNNYFSKKPKIYPWKNTLANQLPFNKKRDLEKKDIEINIKDGNPLARSTFSSVDTIQKIQSLKNKSIIKPVKF